MSITDGIKFCFNCGSNKVSFISDSCKKCAACGYEFYRNPVIGAGAVIFDSQGRLLAIRRAKKPGKGKLGIPGGFVDAGETIEDTLIRESKEEVGVDIKVESYIGNIPNTYMYQGLDCQPLDFFFKCKILDMSNMKIDKTETSEILFIEPDKVNPDEFGLESNKKIMSILFKK